MPDEEIQQSATERAAGEQAAAATGAADGGGAGGGGAAGAGAAAAHVLTAEEVEERSYKGAQRAMADERASAEAARKAEADRQAEVQRRAAGNVNPQVDAMDAFDLRQDMYEEALALHPDLPVEAKEQLKKDIRSFKTVEALKSAHGAGLHIKLADAAAGESMRGGKYVPDKVARSVSVTREPVHTGGGGTSSSVPKEFREAMEEIAADGGFKWTEAEILAEYRRETSR